MLSTIIVIMSIVYGLAGLLFFLLIDKKQLNNNVVGMYLFFCVFLSCFIWSSNKLRMDDQPCFGLEVMNIGIAATLEILGFTLLNEIILATLEMQIFALISMFYYGIVFFMMILELCCQRVQQREQEVYNFAQESP